MTCEAQLKRDATPAVDRELVPPRVGPRIDRCLAQCFRVCGRCAARSSDRLLAARSAGRSLFRSGRHADVEACSRDSTALPVT